MKILRFTLGLGIALGFVTVVGAIGGCDTGMYSFDHAAITACVGLAVLLVCGFFLRCTER